MLINITHLKCVYTFKMFICGVKTSSLKVDISTGSLQKIAYKRFMLNKQLRDPLIESKSDHIQGALLSIQSVNFK